MPELPEVETVINILKPLIIGKEVKKVEVYYDRLIQSDINVFGPSLVDKKILNVTRYGKYIFIHFSGDLVIISHLRMEGKFRYTTEQNPRKKHTSAMFFFKDGSFLAFDDTRKFGLMFLTTEKEYQENPMIKKLGVEANKVKDEDLPFIIKSLHKNKAIKELLLDQTIMTGIGNIYADETLYATKIHPLTKGKDISDEKIIEITKNAKIILDKAIELGGSTIHSFHPSEGVDGRFQEVLTCYGREGDLCPNCGTRFHKIFVGGRGTTFCPNCQVDHSLEKAIGITGPIGSGKSETLKYLAKLGYFSLNCDEIIHELYREPHIKAKISSILKAPFDIDNRALVNNAKAIMINNKDIKQRVENYIYPLLEEKLIKEINDHEKVAIEVPLLFKAHFEYMFKTIIVLQISKEQQIKNLEKRGDNVSSSKKLNSDYAYDKNNPKIKIVTTNGDLEYLYHQIDEIVNA